MGRGKPFGGMGVEDGDGGGWIEMERAGSGGEPRLARLRLLWRGGNMPTCHAIFSSYDHDSEVMVGLGPPKCIGRFRRGLDAFLEPKLGECSEGRSMRRRYPFVV